MLWGLTPREYGALKDQWEDSRQFQQALYAGLQATLHNAHFKQPTGGFRAAQFMPGYVEPKPDPQQQKVISIAHATRPQTDDERQSIEEQNRVFADRARRAHEAQSRGASREEVPGIMGGLAYGG